jgi:hypothetical protein
MKDAIEVVIDRIALKDTYTIGRISVGGFTISDTIEDKVRVLNSAADKIYGETAIPAGTYSADIYFSKKFGYKVIRLFNVPYFTGIYIHRMNSAKDSLGCVGVGTNDKKGWLSNPTIAMNKLTKLVEGKKITVIVE